MLNTISAMAVHPLISYMIPVMAEKARMGADFDSLENVRESIIEFNKGAVDLMEHIHAAPKDGDILGAIQTELETNEPCMRGVARLMCHYVSTDWKPDYQMYDRMCKIIAKVARANTHNKVLVRMVTTIIEFYEAMREREMTRIDGIPHL